MNRSEQYNGTNASVDVFYKEEGNSHPQVNNDLANTIFTLAYAVVFLVSMTTNPFVIHVACYRLKLTRITFNLLVINLAICDILYALLIVFLQLYQMYLGRVWFQGEFALFLCKFVMFAVHVALSISVISLVLMAVDRYMATVHISRQPLSRKKVWIAIAAAWVGAAVMSSTEFYKFRLKSSTVNNSPTTICYPQWSENVQTNTLLYKMEFISKFILLYVFPFITMTVVYLNIISVLWFGRVPRTIKEKRRRHLLQKVILMLLSMVAIFAIGWLPVHVFHFLLIYDTIDELPYSLVLFMTFAAHAHCAINPCLYLVFNKSYREELQRAGQRLQAWYVSSTGKVLTLTRSVFVCRPIMNEDSIN